MTVTAMMREMSALEETYWVALYQLDPWGEHRADIRSAQIAQLLFNQNVKPDKRRKLTDFMPFWRKRVTVEDPDEVSSKLKDRFSLLADKK